MSKKCTPLWREAHLEVKMLKTPGVRTTFEKCTPLWREAHFEVKMYKTHHSRTSFGSWDVEKVHAVVARSTFWSQNVQNTPFSDHFWKLRCWKSARRCGAKHVSKSKCAKHLSVGRLLEVAMSKKCTPLWREAHLEVKILKTLGGSDHFWQLRCRKSARRCGAKHISKWKCTKHLSVGPLLEVEMSKKCTPLWREAHFEFKRAKKKGYGALLDVQMSLRVAGAGDCPPCQKWAKRAGFEAFSTKTTTTPHYTQLHSITFNYTTLHYTTPHSTTFHYTTLHYTTLHYTTLHYTTLHYTTLHSTTLHYTTLYTTFHYTSLHYTTLHYITLHYTTTFHYTSLHYTTLHSPTLQLQLQLHSTTLNYTTLHYIALH